MNSLRLAATAVIFALGSSAAFANACLEAYTSTVEPIVARKCAACHNDASPGSGVSFQKGSGYDNLVNVASEQFPEMMRVTPGNVEQSYFALKVLGTHEQAGGFGSKMPPSGSLRDKEVEAITAWINGCSVTE